MWSLTSPLARHISGPRKFCSSPKKYFFNTTVEGISDIKSVTHLHACCDWTLKKNYSADPADREGKPEPEESAAPVHQTPSP
jgi:hypothetical protein